MDEVALRQIESGAEQVITELLNAYAPKLAAAGLQAKTGGVDRRLGSGGYDSEVAIHIYRDANLVDAFIFMLCLQGNAWTSLEDLKAEVIDDLNSLLGR